MTRRTSAMIFVLFILLAVGAIAIADHMLFSAQKDTADTVSVRKAPPVYVRPEGGAEFFEDKTAVGPARPLPDMAAAEGGTEIVRAEALPAPPVDAALNDMIPAAGMASAGAIKPPKVSSTPNIQAAVVTVPKGIETRAHVTGRPKIAIVLDDIGMDVKRSREAVALPGAVTLAILPYAKHAADFAKEGAANGHRLIIHVPMEAVDKKVDIGPGGLKRTMDDAQFTEAFQKMLVSFTGYDGINNHMGSGMTQDPAAMDRLMRMLKARDLFFLDSMTINTSLGMAKAVEEGVPFARRDVFIDHEDTAQFVAKSLARAEMLALKNGSTIAIGHPKDHTLDALRAWIPTLKAKGIDLVPVKDLLVKPGRHDAVRSPPPAAVIPVSAGADAGTERIIIPAVKKDASAAGTKAGIAAPLSAERTPAPSAPAEYVAPDMFPE